MMDQVRFPPELSSSFSLPFYQKKVKNADQIDQKKK